MNKSHDGSVGAVEFDGVLFEGVGGEGLADREGVGEDVEEEGGGLLGEIGGEGEVRDEGVGLGGYRMPRELESPAQVLAFSPAEVLLIAVLRRRLQAHASASRVAIPL